MESEPQQHEVRRDGVRLVVFEWGTPHRGEQPTLLLAHATGFHARCWDPVIRRLGPVHALAVDQRGHGRSDKPEITHWRAFGEDLAAVARAFSLEGAVGVGHSMGGHALVDAAGIEPLRFGRLLLIDPVIAAPEDYSGPWMAAALGGELHPTAKRKRWFVSAQAMIERFQDRPPYAHFHPEALRAYCEGGLLPAEGPEGEAFELACPPQSEASVYMTSRTNPGIYESVRRLEQPVHVVRVRRPPDERDMMDFSSSPTWPGLAAEFRNGRETHLPEASHFIPLEDPQRAADWILAELEACGAS